jgi:hypothetical protein
VAAGLRLLALLRRAPAAGRHLARTDVQCGQVLVYRDNRPTTNHSCRRFDRATGAQVHPHVIDAMVNAAQ